MEIDRLELFHVAMPLLYPWRTAYGEDAAIHAVLCRMSSGSVDAWGESSPLAAPCYSPEWGGGVFATVRDWLAPAIVGKDIKSGKQLQQELHLYKGNCFAKAVLDTAWWALHSKLTGIPLHVALGASRNEVPVGADFGVMDSIDDLLEAIGGAVSQCFPRVKLKFRPGWDIDMLRAVRKQHPDHTFHIDCNSGYSLDDASLFQTIDEFNLAMIEQPLAHDDVHDHAKLQKLIRTPVCLDETIKNVRNARQAIELKSCQIVNVKPGRVGGLTNAVAIHDLCQAANIPCWVGGMLESSAGSAHCVALSMLDNFTYPPDIFPTSRFYAEDLSDPPLELCESADGIPSARAFEQLPEPAPARLKALTVQHAVVS
ncbi:MAG: o-succinylbenzoate synthase [Planctomycetaceae bacterium]|nr:o-succinylbenzoate synthase [Planctomycetaceae bacterium]